MPDRLRQIALFELGGLLLLLSALLGAPAHGQALPIPIGTEASLPFAAAAELFSETGSRRDVAEVAQSAAFRPLTRQDLLPSYDEGVYWLRATLINRNPQPIERWLVLGSSRLEAVTLFEPEAGGWRATRAGLSVPVQHKPVVAAGVVLPLALAVGEARTVLLRIESRTLIDLDASLWQLLAYLQAQEGRLLLHSLSFGGSLIAALTALFLFGRLRERSYLFFFLLHLSAALTEFCPQAGCILYFRKNYRSLRGEAAMAQKFSSCSEQAWKISRQRARRSSLRPSQTFSANAAQSRQAAS